MLSLPATPTSLTCSALLCMQPPLLTSYQIHTRSGCQISLVPVWRPVTDLVCPCFCCCVCLLVMSFLSLTQASGRFLFARYNWSPAWGPCCLLLVRLPVRAIIVLNLVPLYFITSLCDEDKDKAENVRLVKIKVLPVSVTLCLFW